MDFEMMTLKVYIQSLVEEYKDYRLERSLEKSIVKNWKKSCNKILMKKEALCCIFGKLINDYNTISSIHYDNGVWRIRINLPKNIQEKNEKIIDILKNDLNVDLDYAL